MDGEGNKRPCESEETRLPAASGKAGISDQVEREPGLKGRDIVGGGVWQMDSTWKGSKTWSVGKDWRKGGWGSL